MGNRHDDPEEREWSALTRMAGLGGLFWALVKLLIQKNVFTIEEYRAVLQVEVGGREPLVGDDRPQRRYQVKAWDLSESRERVWLTVAHSPEDAAAQWEIERKRETMYRDGQMVPTCTTAWAVGP